MSEMHPAVPAALHLAREIGLDDPELHSVRNGVAFDLDYVDGQKYRVAVTLPGSDQAQHEQLLDQRKDI